MTDDLDVLTLYKMLDNDLMPNLQEFVIDRGTGFTNSFVTDSVCCPSRATFLTGQYAHNHGVLTNFDILQFNDSHTLATWLDYDGYNTGLIGKYLNKYGDYVSEHYIPPGWDNWQVLVEPYHSMVYGYKISNNGNVKEYGYRSEDYQTDVFATLSSNFIRQSIAEDNVPFFLEISTKTPHGERATKSCNTNNIMKLHRMRGPERYLGSAEKIQFPILPSFNETDITDKPEYFTNLTPIHAKGLDCIQRVYQSGIESMRAVDDLIGNVMHTLIENKEFDNTVIIFTSDNGYVFGDHLLAGKVYPYENSIRVPLFISAPGYKGSQTASQLVINNDLAPTILELANATSDISMDGRSLVPLLLNPNEENWREKFLVEFWSGKADNWPSYKAVRTSSEIYVKNQGFKDEFYDLKTDPFQLKNQIEKPTFSLIKKVEIFKNWLEELENCKDGTCQLFEDIHTSDN